LKTYQCIVVVAIRWEETSLHHHRTQSAAAVVASAADVAAAVVANAIARSTVPDAYLKSATVSSVAAVAVELVNHIRFPAKPYAPSPFPMLNDGYFRWKKIAIRIEMQISIHTAVDEC
jgi:hypothetical protein